jgi:hypothetical protein
MMVTVITTNLSFLLQDFIFIYHKNKCFNTLSEILASSLQMTFIFWSFLYFIIFLLNPLPPHARHGLRGLPSGCGRSVTDF